MDEGVKSIAKYQRLLSETSPFSTFFLIKAVDNVDYEPKNILITGGAGFM